MKKSILVLLFSFLVVACGDNKEVKEKVGSDPVTVQLTVVNKTGKDMPGIKVPPSKLVR